MVSEIENGHTETVTKLGETVGEVNAKQSEIAQTTADWQTDFSGQMDEMVKKMGTTVDDLVTEMNASEGARTSAINTLSAYAEQIKASGGHAVDNARDIANQVSSALNSASTNISISVSGGKLNASQDYVGAISASSGYALVGERGAELVKFSGGERVYTHEETISILTNREVIPELWENAYEKGTKSAAPGVALVGEKGPELIVMHGGERVYTHEETISILSDREVIPELWENAYASGTTSAVPGIALVGEKGPELVVMQDGERVYNTGDFNAANRSESTYSAHFLDSEKPYYVLPESSESTKSTSENSSDSRKEVDLNLNVNGSVSVQRTANVEDVVSIMIEKLVPILTIIASQEIFEEGDNSYDY